MFEVKKKNISSVYYTNSNFGFRVEKNILILCKNAIGQTSDFQISLKV